MEKKRKKSLLIVCILFLIGIGAYIVFAGSEENTSVVTKEVNKKIVEDSEEKYSTVTPIMTDEGQSLSLIGTVVSNEFATIYARRSGIIKDLYVDIGDSVKGNQTIGELLSAGDIGQSSANIYEKQVRVEEAKANLGFIEKVSEQMVGKASLEKDLQKIDGNTSSAETLAKINVDIESSRRELAQLEVKHKEELKKIQNDLSQKKDQALVLVASTIQTLEHIMLGSDHNTTSIATDDLRNNLGTRNTAKKHESLDLYRRLVSAYDGSQSIEILLDQTYQTIDTFLAMVQASTEGSGLTQSMLEEFTQMLLSKQSAILNNKEMLEDIENSYVTTVESQKQAIIMVQNMIDKGSALLGEKTATLQSSLEKSEQQVDLIIAEQGLKLQQARNMVNIAQANLGKEYASSGNDKVVSPFSGTISKRMVQVGDMVSMGMPLYELIDVSTSLSKKAKREIQFGLPEEYLDLIGVGDAIYFTTAQNDALVYTGEIHRISPQVDEMNKTITVQAILPDGINLSHNSRVNVSLEKIQQQLYQIPTSSIIYTDGETYVALLNEDEEVTIISISVLADDGEFADVQGDLSINDKIIENY